MLDVDAQRTKGLTQKFIRFALNIPGISNNRLADKTSIQNLCERLNGGFGEKYKIHRKKKRFLDRKDRVYPSLTDYLFARRLGLNILQPVQ